MKSLAELRHELTSSAAEATQRPGSADDENQRGLRKPNGGLPGDSTVSLSSDQRQKRKDAPVVTKGELTGSLGVYAERLAAERELFAKLDVAQLEELAAASQALVDKAMAMVRANASPMLVGVSPSPAGSVGDVIACEPAEQSTDCMVPDRRGAGAASDPERTPRGTH